MSFNSPLSKKIESLTKTVAQSSELIKKETGYLEGRLYTFSSKKMKMPKWAEEHILATQELQSAIYEAEKGGESISKHTFQTLEIAKEIVKKLANMVETSEFINLTLSREPNLSPESLLKEVTTQIRREEFEWHLNLGLIMDVYKHTSDQLLKKKLSFLALQYLAKAAPLEREQSLDVSVGFFTDRTYHREHGTFEKYFEPIFVKKKIIPLEYHDMVLIDNKECQELFPLMYSVINLTDIDEKSNNWVDNIYESTSSYFSSGDFNKFLEPALLFDFTEEIGDLLIQSEKNDNKSAFENKIQELENKIDQSIDRAANSIQKNFPNLTLSVEEIKAIIRANISCISRHDIDGVGVIKFLPIFNKQEYYDAIKMNRKIAGSKIGDVLNCRNHMMDLFLNRTGIRLGAVRSRTALFDHYSLEDFLEKERNFGLKAIQTVEYAPLGKNIVYFPKKDSILELKLFERFERNFENYSDLLEIEPSMAVLGRATTEILKGLINELSEKTWKELNESPDTRLLIQTALFRLSQHLAHAAHAIPAFDSSPNAKIAFVRSIELMHAEITTLLSLFSPFTESEFEPIYQLHLTHIPAKLRQFLKIGLGKTAMNTFAGINAAITRTTYPEQPHRVIDKNTYFEEVQVIGYQKTTEEALKDTKSKKVDLYVSEFNHNINIDPQHHHYTPTDIIGEVEKLIAQKPLTKYLTVAIDLTIDFTNSSKVEELLNHFENEILDGKINFIFFKSGLKFDMLGMDSYYGAPFYLINNGDKQWNEMNKMIKNPLYKTDLLSVQWFCLANKYAFQEMEDYRKVIFHNTRAILNQLPDPLNPKNKGSVQVSTSDPKMDTCFLDIKTPGRGLNALNLEERLINKFEKYGSILHARSSFGFTHTNYTVIMSSEGFPTNLRINPGLDPLDVKIINEFLDDIAKEVHTQKLS